MTTAEAQKVVSYLMAMFEHASNPETVAGYCHALQNVEFEAGMLAAEQHVASSRYFPRVSELFELVAQAECGAPPAEQAWADVARSIRHDGRYRTWSFENPITQQAVDAIGQGDFCNSQNLAVERAQFIRVYESYRTSALRGAREFQLLGRMTPRRCLGPRHAGAGVAEALAPMMKGSTDYELDA